MESLWTKLTRVLSCSPVGWISEPHDLSIHFSDHIISSLRLQQRVFYLKIHCKGAVLLALTRRVCITRSPGSERWRLALPWRSEGATWLYPWTAFVSHTNWTKTGKSWWRLDRNVGKYFIFWREGALPNFRNYGLLDRYADMIHQQRKMFWRPGLLGNGLVPCAWPLKWSNSSDSCI